MNHSRNLDAILNKGFEHASFQSPMQQFKQEYPKLDAYGRKVASGRQFKETMGTLAGALDNTSGQLMEGKADTGAGNIMDYMGFGAMTAFHGSPHKFDKFSLDNIGTGEGAQAYGHGLYFAENPKVAGEYKEAGLKMSPRARMAYDDAGGDWSKAKEIAQNKAKADKSWSDAADELSEVKKGSMYEVDIPDKDIANFLDWDAPLSELNTDIKDSLLSLEDGIDGNFWSGDYQALESLKGKMNKSFDGNDLYQELRVLLDESGKYAGKGVSSDVMASEYLNSLGIKGIKYLDGTSRSAGEGTRNLVVFDDNIVKMLSRNGESINPVYDDLMGEFVGPEYIPAMLRRQESGGIPELPPMNKAELAQTEKDLLAKFRAMEEFAIDPNYVRKPSPQQRFSMEDMARIDREKARNYGK